MSAHASRRGRALASLAASLVAALAVAGGAAAHPFDIVGFGSRPAALAGAVTASAEGYEAAFYNPAAVVRSPDVHVGLGWVQSFSDLGVNGDDFELRDTIVSIFTAGVAIGGSLGERPFGLSLAMAIPSQGAIRATVLAPERPSFVTLTNRTQRAEALVTAGLEVLPGLAIGGGLALGAELDGTIDISATLAPNTAIDGILDVSLKTRVFPLVGVELEVAPPLRLGVAFRGESSFPLNEPANLALELTPGSPIGAELVLLVRETFHVTPDQVVVGVAWDPAERWTVSADLEWSDWSAVEPSVLKGKLGVEGALSAVLAPPDFAEPEVVPLEDALVPRLGLEMRPEDAPLGLAAVRLGYSYQPAIVPLPVAGRRNLLDNEKHSVAFGLGFAGRDPWGVLLADARFDVHVQYVRFAERRARKVDPADPIGDLAFGGDRWILGGMLTLVF